MLISEFSEKVDLKTLNKPNLANVTTSDKHSWYEKLILFVLILNHISETFGHRIQGSLFYIFVFLMMMPLDH